MPWTRRGNEHVFVQSNRLVSRAPSTESPASFIDTGSLPIGSWAQWTGEPTTTTTWATNGASGKLKNAHGRIEQAQPHSRTVAGVVTQVNQLTTDGVVLAWVVKKKRTLDLSGIYQTSENGVHVANTAIIQRNNFFVMARSHDDDVKKLTDQFAELTGV